MNPFRAAKLIDEAYRGTIKADHSLDKNGVQAHMVGGVLVIPGTNETSDWFNFNFQGVLSGATRTWHRGFLKHARTVFEWAKPLQPTAITGHSLGAASAQIVGYSLPETPTIAFASPRVLVKGKKHWEGAEWVQNYCRSDDLVCHVPSRFQHIGKVRWLTPRKPHIGEDHRISHYRDILKESGI